MLAKFLKKCFKSYFISSIKLCLYKKLAYFGTLALTSIVCFRGNSKIFRKLPTCSFKCVNYRSSRSGRSSTIRHIVIQYFLCRRRRVTRAPTTFWLYNFVLRIYKNICTHDLECFCFVTSFKLCFNNSNVLFWAYLITFHPKSVFFFYSDEKKKIHLEKIILQLPKLKIDIIERNFRPKI